MEWRGRKEGGGEGIGKGCLLLNGGLVTPLHIRKEQDSSMNRDEGSYQLSHIYDRLFAATSGGERKLSRPFRRRQQPLPKRQQ